MRRSFSGWLRTTSDKECPNDRYEDPKKAFQEIEDDEISLKAENKRLRLSFKNENQIARSDSVFSSIILIGLNDRPIGIILKVIKVC